jgi:hypothetical protein
MSVKWMRLAAAALALALLLGCQATPEQPVVVQKDMAQMVEKAQATPEALTPGLSLRERIGAPETYITDIEAYNGDLIVSVNANVTVPDSAGISMTRVERSYFTQEEADRMLDVFLQGATLYDIDLSLTKAEVQEKLMMYYAMRDGSIPIDIDGEHPDDPGKLKQIIAGYEAMLADAPETKTAVDADTEFHTPKMLVNPDAKVIEGVATVNGKAAYLHINNGLFGENDVEAVFINDKPQITDDFNTCHYRGLTDEMLPRVHVPDNFTMTESQAQEAAEDILARLGIMGMACVDIQYAVMADGFIGDVMLEPGAVIAPLLENGKWAYSLQFQRAVSGIPVTLTEHYGSGSTDENDVSEPWPYERLNIVVDETGVIYFDYLSPYLIKDTVTGDSSLLMFSEVTSVFEKMFPVVYGYVTDAGVDYALQVKITEARLGLMRITEENSRHTGLLIPVWDFFGDVTVMPEGSIPYEQTGGSLLTVNAIDGSVIDRGLGY